MPDGTYVEAASWRPADGFKAWRDYDAEGGTVFTSPEPLRPVVWPGRVPPTRGTVDLPLTVNGRVLGTVRTLGRGAEFTVLLLLPFSYYPSAERWAAGAARAWDRALRDPALAGAARRVRFVMRDSACDGPAAARQFDAQRRQRSPPLLAVVGTYCSRAALGVSAANRALPAPGVPVLNYGSSATGLSSRPGDAWFRLWASNKFHAAVQLELCRAHGWHEVVLLHGDDVFGMDAAEQFGVMAAQHGVRAPCIEAFPVGSGAAGDPRRRAALQAIKDACPRNRVIVVSAPGGADLDRLMPAAHRLGMVGEGWMWLPNAGAIRDASLGTLALLAGALFAEGYVRDYPPEYPGVWTPWVEDAT
eukprot:gene3745-4678_t